MTWLFDTNTTILQSNIVDLVVWFHTNTTILQSNKIRNYFNSPLFTKGHLYNQTTSIIRPPLLSDHLYNQTTSIIRPPLLSDHLYHQTTSIIRPPLYNQATSIIRPPLLSGHLYYQTTSIIRPPLLSDHLYYQTTSIIRPPLSSDHLYYQITSIIRPPLSSDHLYNQARFQMHWDGKILLNSPLKCDHPYYNASFLCRSVVLIRGVLLYLYTYSADLQPFTQLIFISVKVHKSLLKRIIRVELFFKIIISYETNIFRWEKMKEKKFGQAKHLEELNI